jgi:hypothetical protein
MFLELLIPCLPRLQGSVRMLYSQYGLCLHGGVKSAYRQIVGHARRTASEATSPHFYRVHLHTYSPSHIPPPQGTHMSRRRQYYGPSAEESHVRVNPRRPVKGDNETTHIKPRTLRARKVETMRHFQQLLFDQVSQSTFETPKTPSLICPVLLHNWR